MDKLLLSCDFTDSIATETMADKLSYHFCKDIVILNIGTNKHIHDTMGPLIGTTLYNKGFKFPIYGTLDKPVDNTNLIETIRSLYLKYGDNLFILAIDASYSDGMDGTIALRNSPVKPGTAVRDSFIGIGDMSIIGVVSSHYEKHPQINDFDMVADLAKEISNILLKAQDNYFKLLENVSA